MSHCRRRRRTALVRHIGKGLTPGESAFRCHPLNSEHRLAVCIPTRRPGQTRPLAQRSGGLAGMAHHVADAPVAVVTRTMDGREQGKLQRQDDKADFHRGRASANERDSGLQYRRNHTE